MEGRQQVDADPPPLSSDPPRERRGRPSHETRKDKGELLKHFHADPQTQHALRVICEDRHQAEATAVRAVLWEEFRRVEFRRAQLRALALVPPTGGEQQALPLEPIPPPPSPVPVVSPVEASAQGGFTAETKPPAVMQPKAIPAVVRGQHEANKAARAKEKADAQALASKLRELEQRAEQLGREAGYGTASKVTNPAANGGTLVEPRHTNMVMSDVDRVLGLLEPLPDTHKAPAYRALLRELASKGYGRGWKDFVDDPHTIKRAANEPALKPRKLRKQFVAHLHGITHRIAVERAASSTAVVCSDSDIAHLMRELDEATATPGELPIHSCLSDDLRQDLEAEFRETFAKHAKPAQTTTTKKPAPASAKAVSPSMPTPKSSSPPPGRVAPKAKPEGKSWPQREIARAAHEMGAKLAPARSKKAASEWDKKRLREMVEAMGVRPRTHGDKGYARALKHALGWFVMALAGGKAPLEDAPTAKSSAPAPLTKTDPQALERLYQEAEAIGEADREKKELHRDEEGVPHPSRVRDVRTFLAVGYARSVLPEDIDLQRLTQAYGMGHYPPGE